MSTGIDPSSDLVARIIAMHGSAQLRAVADDAATYRFQVLLGTIGASGQLQLHGFRCGAEYIYPASTVKLASAVAALVEIDHIRSRDIPITADTSFRLHPVFADQRLEAADATNIVTGMLSVAHEIRKVMLVSDNPAHNRLIAIPGVAQLHRTLSSLGLHDARLFHRLSEARAPEENLKTGRVDFIADTGDVIATFPQRTSPPLPAPAPVPSTLVGCCHTTDTGTVDGPMDFARKNHLSLPEMQRLLAMIARPDLSIDGQPIGDGAISREHRKLLCTAMGLLPRQSSNPVYDASEFPDHFVKFILPGLARVIDPADARCLNKVGQAYGFSIDNGYFFDARRGLPFFMSAAIFTCAGGNIGSEQYEYPLAEAVLADLGHAVAKELWAAK